MRTCAIAATLTVTSSLVLGAFAPSTPGATAADGAGTPEPVAAAAPRQAGGSIAFVRGGDVWLATPDGAREHRVTSTGGFASVTQADDGTLVAVKDSALHRMDRSGQALDPPFRVLAYGAYGVLSETTPAAPDLSPDGSKVAYWVPTTCATPLDPCLRVQVTDARRASVPEQDYMTQTGWHPTWTSNDRLVYSNRGSGIFTTALTAGSWDAWVYDPDPAIPMTVTSALTRAGDRLAFVSGPDLDAPWRIRFYSVAGTLPTATATPVCTRELGTARPGRLSWSPDGSGIAWEEPAGVRVMASFTATDCAAAGGRTIAGATSPDWGPAEVPVLPPGTGDPDPEVGTPPAGKLLASAAVKRRQSVRTVLRKGLKVSLRCTTRCAVTGTMKRGPKKIGTTRRTFSGRSTLSIRPSKAGKRVLRSTGRRTRLTVRLVATAPGVRNVRTVRVSLPRG